MTLFSAMQRDYRPYDDRAQPPRTIDGYPRSQRRTPMGPFVERPLTRTERTGPTGLERKLRMGPSDLSRQTPDGAQAIGQYLYVTGRVLDEDGAPLHRAIIELWQANSAGKYVHALDGNDAPIDPNFTGAARVITDAQGLFSFRTIKPGAYPVPHSSWEWRAPHIHVSIFGRSWMSRLVTQLFFPGEPLNAQDLLLNAIPSETARERLIVRPLPTIVKPSGNILGFEHEFVLRGKQATPTLIDHDENGPDTAGAVANLTTGPFFPPELLDAGCDDLTSFDGERAMGTRILLTGRVLEDGLGPTVNTIVEIWQADGNGILRHPDDPRVDAVDPGFAGWGRACTDSDGRYRLTTVLPGSYIEDDGTLRRPHINVMVLASGILRPLVTTVFFDDPVAAMSDPVLDAVTDPARRQRLFALRAPELDADGALAYRFDLVLRGDAETPFFLD